MGVEDGVADLHMHTVTSDGTCSLTERIEQAKECNLNAIAITDHDSLSNNIEGRTTNVGNLELITGVEVRAGIQDTKVELLGYYIDPKNQQLANILAEVRDYRRNRNRQIIKRLQETTCFNRSYEDVYTETDGILGRPHIANVLIQEKIVSSIDKAFEKYLATDGRAFVPMKRVPASEVIDAIQGAGGVISLAHPGRIRTDDIEAIINELVKVGLDAIEVQYPYDAAPTESYADVSVEDAAALADEHGVLQTGGSDCHGPGSGKFRIGEVRVSEAQLEALREYADQRRPL